jgi:sec-independent protein translocase protein TatB
MFNLGGGEALVIALIALIVLGPNRLPEAARTVGKVVGEVRRLSSGFQNEVRDAFKDAEADTATKPSSTPKARESAPLAAAVDRLNRSSEARDDLAPEPVEASEPARPAATMAEADRGPSASTPVPPPGGNGNGQYADDAVAPEVADALDEILGPPPASAAGSAPESSATSPPATPPEADTP